MRIGVVSDTHGILRPEMIDGLAGVDLIIHAGDIGSLAVLERLEEIARVIPVRGNVDSGSWAGGIPGVRRFETNGKRFAVVHDAAALSLDPHDPVDVIIFGHSHRPSIAYKDGTLLFNPGSSGPRRFRLPTSFGLLTIEGDGMHPEIVYLRPPAERQ